MNAGLIVGLAFSAISTVMGQTVAAQNTDSANPQTNQQTMQQKSDKEADNVSLQTQLAEIEKKRKQVENYDPMVKGYLVSYSPQDYILLAVSPSEREKWLKNLNIQQSSHNELNAALDALAVAAAQKLPIYRIDIGSYTVRDAAEEEVMKAALPNLATLEIHKIGLKQINWQIVKDDNGQPTARRKSGVILARDAAEDHPYCWLYYVHVVQDYTDGAYGGPYGKLTTKQLVGCPKTTQPISDDERHD